MTRARQPKPVSSLLQKSRLQHNTSLLTKLNSLLQSYLKQHNIQDCRIGNLQSGSLIIEIANATWLIRLQFIQTELLSLFRKQSPGLKKIEFKVNPRLKLSNATAKRKTNKVVKRAAKMPTDVANSFLAMADEADPALKKALQSLAKYTKKEDH